MKRFKYRILYLLLLASIPGLMGFGSAPQSASQATSFAANGKGKRNGKVSQAELQDDLLRFETQFNAQVQSADQDLETSPNPKTRYRAALNRLIYGSNSLNIALGPSPESNLLDMVTWNHLLSSPAYQKGASQMAGIASQVDVESSHFLRKLAWLGVGLITFFWVMFVLSKLAYRYFHLRFLGRPRSSVHEDQKSKAA